LRDVLAEAERLGAELTADPTSDGCSGDRSRLSR
jgi:hypothetical protein